METLKLILVSISLLLIVLGGLYIIFVKKESSKPNSNSDNSPITHGCGCGSGKCGSATTEGNSKC